MHGFPVATAAVNIDDPIPMPDGEILVHPAGEKDCGCVADNADSVWVGTSAARFRPAPDAGMEIVTGEAVNQMKVSAADGDLQAVRQTGEKRRMQFRLWGVLW